jgi:hypothetical protein
MYLIDWIFAGACIILAKPPSRSPTGGKLGLGFSKNKRIK